MFIIAPMTEQPLYGGIEAGGTKFVCLVGSDPGTIVASVRVLTTSPEETLGRVIDFFRPFAASGQVGSIGVGCFGPLDLDQDSGTFGYITSTPKISWSHTDIVRALRMPLKVAVTLDTDVNAAALGEFRWGASKGVDPSLYLTVGTGIGGGFVLRGRPLHGMLTPEMGHIRIPHDTGLDPFPGCCPFHGDCFEGLASGTAIQERLGEPAKDLPAEHPFWELETRYIADALVNYIVTLSPKRIVLGGGVMQRVDLFPRIRERVRERLNGYVQHRSVLADIDQYLVPPGLGPLSGSLGAIALAQLGQEN